jgi:CTP synthase
VPVRKETKYIFVCGGVVSGLGKGIVSASVGMLLKACGYKVNHIKIDPYLNVDAGTMRPAEHGEVFVTDDGGEIDQDLGNYERFTNTSFSKDHNITSGKVFQTIISNERAFKYEGRDVEMIPDVPNEIKRRFFELEDGNDFTVVEIGGTTGDIENLPFLYAAREMGRDRKSLYIMVSYVPFLKNVGELKTKPTQHAVSQLRSTGINPDILITRGEFPLDAPRRETLGRRCFLEEGAVFDDPDAESIYEVPLILEKQGLVSRIHRHFQMADKKPKLNEWKAFVEKVKKPGKKITIALVGKYVKHGGAMHRDVYVSVLEAVRHAAGKLGVEAEVIPVDAGEFDIKELAEIKPDGIIVPQGWGSRGVEGKVKAVTFARENKIPYLGLCFGMQMAVVEFARNMAGLAGANTEEADELSPYKVIHIMPEQAEYLKKHQYGGTIRLGSWPCAVKKGTILEEAYIKYGKEPNEIQKSNNKSTNQIQNLINERHRHRYEFNNEYRDKLEKAGLIISGTSPDGKLVEAIELPRSVHPFFMGTQFHPEYKSRPMSPHPIFTEFIAQAGGIV